MQPMNSIWEQLQPTLKMCQSGTVVPEYGTIVFISIKQATNFSLWARPAKASTNFPAAELYLNGTIVFISYTCNYTQYVSLKLDYNVQ